MVKTKLPSVVSVAVNVTVSATLSFASNSATPRGSVTPGAEPPIPMGCVWMLPAGAPWMVAVFPDNGFPN